MCHSHWASSSCATNRIVDVNCDPNQGNAYQALHHKATSFWAPFSTALFGINLLCAAREETGVMHQESICLLQEIYLINFFIHLGWGY